MKTNPNDLLNQLPTFSESESSNPVTMSSGGLTKREYFAAMALVGVLSGRRSGLDGEWAANAAVEIADNLINELNKG